MKVFLTRRIPEEALEILKDAEIDIEIFPYDRPPSKKEIMGGIKDADALISLLTDKIDKEIIDYAKNLKIIANYAVGYNNIDIEYAKSRGIVVTNTPGVLTEATADLTFALILAAARRVVEGDNYVREGKFNGWAPTLMLGKKIWGATIGIIGAGRIGQAVGRRAKGFNMKILYHSRTRKESFENETGATYTDLESLVKNSDIITIHTPLTRNTFHLINKKHFDIMKKGAIFINTARGEVVDEEAMIDALKSHKIFAAGLDVFYNEPEINPELLKLQNVVLTPHVGSATESTRKKMAEMVCTDVVRVLQGKDPLNKVV